LVGVANSGRLLLLLLLDGGGGVSGGSWCSRHGSGVAGSWYTPIKYLESSMIDGAYRPSVLTIIWCVRSSDDGRS
jgi:hypothetical protein